MSPKMTDGTPTTSVRVQERLAERQLDLKRGRPRRGSDRPIDALTIEPSCQVHHLDERARRHTERMLDAAEDPQVAVNTVRSQAASEPRCPWDLRPVGQEDDGARHRVINDDERRAERRDHSTLVS